MLKFSKNFCAEIRWVFHKSVINKGNWGKVINNC